MIFLNVPPIVLLSAKPHLSAISVIERLVLTKRSAAACVLTLIRYYLNLKPVKALNFLERLDSLILKSSAVAAIVMSL